MLCALAGGVGGAKLAHGLSRILPPEDLAIVVNVGDDFEHLGLHVSPDIDTVVYTLAGIANPETGWGVAGETWSFMDALGALGGETWFRLGDRDLATHVERTRLLAEGAPLSAVTTRLARQLGVAAAIVPASDDPVRTFVATDEGELEFQHYFVRRHCAPRVSSLSYRNADTARPAPIGGRRMDRDGDRGGDHLPVQPISQHRADPGDAGRARLAKGPPLPGCGGFPDRCRAGAEGAGG